MGVSVVVPWRASADREPLWAFLRPRWERLGYEVVVAEMPDGPWRKGLAVAAGVGMSSGDVLVIADADVWCETVPEAVAAVQASVAWAVPHARIMRLSGASTAAVLYGHDFLQAWMTLGGERPPHPAVPGGGITVLRRDVFNRCPMPVMGRREDEAWLRVLYPAFGRPWRGTADLWHLYHAPAVDE